MESELKILFVEDMPADVEFAKRTLDKEGIKFQSLIVENEIDFIRELEQFVPDIIISDYSMPHFDGMRALKISLEKCHNTPFILLTGSLNEETAVECIKTGASDYLIKEQITRLPFAVKDALEKTKTRLEKEKAEQSLKESEEKFSKAFLSSPYSLTISRLRDGQIIETNQAFTSILGYTREEASTVPSLGLKLWVNLEDRKHVIADLLEGKEVINREFLFKKKNGEIITCLFSAKLISLNNEQCFLISIDDISELKRMEDELRESEEKFSKAFRTSPYGLTISHVEDGRFIEANEAFTSITGFTREEVLADSSIGLKLWVDPEDRKCLVSDLLESKEVSNKEYQFRLKNGNVIDGLLSSQILHLKDKVCILSSISNITERKQAENKLRKLSTAVEQSPISIIITDLDGSIEYANPKVSEITGYKLEELIGKNSRILSSGEITKSEYKVLWDTISSGKEWQGEFHNKKKNGEFYWESASISSVTNEKGEITNYLAVKEDITEKKKMLYDLIDAKERAEELNRLKSNFMANMSHELRTPLVGLLGISEFMKEELEGENKENAKIIHESGLRLLNTLTEILNFSKLESDKIVVNLSVINLTQLLLYEIKLYQTLASQKGIAIIEYFSTEDVPIKTDEKMLCEIIGNLINNAIKFTFTGAVTVSLEQTDGEIIIKISDTGIGIPKDKLKIIFEEFRQVSEGMSRNFEGSGLGLAIVKKYILFLNGSIEVESELGIGSTFIVRLPVTQLSEEVKSFPNGDVLQNSENTLAHIVMNKVLIVEDDLINARTIEKMLKRDYEVLLVSSGTEAIKLVSNQSVDVILMDINLKHTMNGIKTAQEIHKIPGYENKPIVAMTAYAMPNERDEFIKNGCSHYIAKPFSKNEILHLLEDILKA
jgi:PAS domain S-box-containing protein